MNERRRYEGTFRVTEPDEVPMTLTITMTIADWKLLRDQQDSSKFPAFFLRDHINEAFAKLIKHAGSTMEDQCEAKS